MSSERSHSDAKGVQAIIVALLAEARAGDAASAVMTAMLIHSYPEAAQATGVSALYQWLLAQSFQSQDPELLACLAEELLKGKHLAADPKMAHRAVTKSNEISGFMGAYVVGRLTAKTKPDFAIKQFRKGRQAGHIPSMVFEHELRSRSVPLVGAITRWWFKIFDAFSAWPAYFTKDKRRLWRGSDVCFSLRAKNEFQALIGPDRQTPFSRIDALVLGTVDPDGVVLQPASPLIRSVTEHAHWMSTEPVDSSEKPRRQLHWPLRLICGSFIAVCSVACFIGSCVLIFAPRSPNPLVAQAIGVVMALLCTWLLSVGMRLLFNRPDHGGLLSPLVLRLLAIYMVVWPTFIIVTGGASTWTAIQCVQAIFFLIGAAGLWRLANWRKASTLRA